MSKISEFSETVLKKFKENITDGVFLYIQNDRDLMQRYLEIAKNPEDREAVNRLIGKNVLNTFELIKADTRSECPKSTLIKSHQDYTIQKERPE